MKTKRIELDAMFTPYTIDTYQTFTLESEEEYIIEQFNDDESIEKEITYDDIDWTYDNPGFVKALAKKRLEVLRDNIIDDVILAIGETTNITSPNEYNYRTDNCHNIFTVNSEALDKFITDNLADYNENKLKDCDGFWWFGDEDQTKLNYYLRKNKYGESESMFEAYYYDMVDGFDYSDFITYELIKQ